MQWNDSFWENVIDKNGLEIGNDGRHTHHWKREDQEGKSVIDLTLANRLIVQWTILADDHATGSDHEVLEWEVGVDRQEEADHKRVVAWFLAAMMEKDVEAAEKLWMELVKERAQLDAECKEDEGEQEAAWSQEAMSSVFDATAKKIKICATSNRWWNADIKDRTRTVARERTRGRNSEEAALANAELQTSMWRSKRDRLSNYLQTLRGAEVWRAG